MRGPRRGPPLSPPPKKWKGAPPELRWRAEYRCLSCSLEWEAPAGPTECPGCQGLYVEWTNYERLAKARGKA